MSKHIQLSISNPCHENWDNMSPAEKGRFCGSCQKHVIDFSSKSDREIAQFFKKPSSGSICGRFMQDQLDRSIEIPKKRIPWVKYFFQITLPAFLVSLKTSAQKEERLMGKVSPVCTQQFMGNATVLPVKMPAMDSIIITGRIISESGDPIPFASIRIKETVTGVSSNEDGMFSIKLGKETKNKNILVSAVGFESKEVNLNGSEFQNIVLKLNAKATLGEVVITSDTYRRTVGLLGTVSMITISNPVADLKYLIQDTVKVYPNPLRSGGIINFEVLKFGLGKTLVELYNMAGQKVYFTELTMSSKNWKASLPLPTLVAGTYIVKVYLQENKKSYSTKMIVQ